MWRSKSDSATLRHKQVVKVWWGCKGQHNLPKWKGRSYKHMHTWWKQKETQVNAKVDMWVTQQNLIFSHFEGQIWDNQISQSA